LVEQKRSTPREEALELFHGRDDDEAAALVADLERIVDRTRRHLAAATEASSRA
jgi:hypothetical protein